MSSRRNPPDVSVSGAWLWPLLLGQLVLVWLPQFSSAGSASDLELFLGRFHPSLVHFPIAILVVAIFLSALRYFGRLPGLLQTITLLIYVGAWSAMIASFAGMFLSRAGGYEASTIFWHRSSGIFIAVAASVWWYLMARTTAMRRLNGVSIALMGSLFVVIVIGGHLGGTLTHQEGYLTRYLPDPIRSAAGMPLKGDIGRVLIEDPSTATVYETFVRPVIEQKCVACHNEETSRGSLSLESPESIMSGGGDGPALVPGSASESLIIERIWLPPLHEDHMPPQDRPQVTVAEAEVIRWWIDSGAAFDETLDTIEPSQTIRTILAAYGLVEPPTGIFALTIPWPDTLDVLNAQATGLTVAYLSQDTPFLEVRCERTTECLGPEQRIAIQPLVDQIARFDAAESVLSDSAMALISQFKHLMHARLEKTEIDDEDVQKLQNLEYLEVLNIHGTGITDEGLSAVARLPALRSVYAWQTSVTADGVAAVHAEFPSIEVNLGTQNE